MQTGRRDLAALLCGVVTLTTFLAACGAPAPPAATSSSAPPVADVAGDTWAATSWEDRHDTMTWSVLPAMAKRFQAFRGEASPTLTCRSCHGADAEAVAYAMPHDLPALDPKHMPSRTSTDPRTAKLVAFMEDEVTPSVASMLDLRVVAPGEAAAREPGTFSCCSCHPVAP